MMDVRQHDTAKGAVQGVNRYVQQQARTGHDNRVKVPARRDRTFDDGLSAHQMRLPRLPALIRASGDTGKLPEVAHGSQMPGSRTANDLGDVAQHDTLEMSVDMS